MSDSPSTRVGQHRRQLLTSVTSTSDKELALQPTPPPGGRRPSSSSSSRAGSGCSTRSRHSSVGSKVSLMEIPKLSRQNSLLTPITNEISE